MPTGMSDIKHAIIAHKKQIVTAILVLVAFVIGLIIPSPFFRRIMTLDGFENAEVPLRDTTDMVLADGSIYEGSLNARNNEFYGYGVLTKGSSVYEGNWKDGRLPYGKRTTGQSVYEGRFDSELNNDGFGIIHYSSEYVKGKRLEGKKDNEITITYIGNWKKNVKSGIGRSVKADSSMEFGNYKDGLFQKDTGANFAVGEKVYGIDVSRHQDDIDWNRLAIFCDENGDVFHRNPSGKKYMQPVFFVYIKATEGTTVKDETFDIRMVEAERHGIVKGAYHFLRLGSSIDGQIKNFTETVSWTPGDLPPALDVEVESEIEAHGVDKLLDMTYTWLEEVEARMGVRPVIYTRESIRDKYLAKDSRFGKYECWIARYHPDGPKKESWRFWQMSEKGKVNGYDGMIDIDMYKGNFDSFSQYLKELGR